MSFVPYPCHLWLNEVLFFFLLPFIVKPIFLLFFVPSPCTLWLNQILYFSLLPLKVKPLFLVFFVPSPCPLWLNQILYFFLLPLIVKPLFLVSFVPSPCPLWLIFNQLLQSHTYLIRIRQQSKLQITVQRNRWCIHCSNNCNWYVQVFETLTLNSSC